MALIPGRVARGWSDRHADYWASKAPVLSARRLLASAQRAIPDITAVLGSPPTITNPASDNANSTIITNASTTQGQGRFNSGVDTTIIGGPFGSTGIIETIRALDNSYFGGHSSGIAFVTNAPDVDFMLRLVSSNWTAYVTELATGVRGRIAANDQAQAFSGGRNYYKLSFGSASPRLMEVYAGPTAVSYGGVNVATGYTVRKADNLMAQPRIAAIWDSFGAGDMNSTTLRVKLAALDFFAARFGCSNMHINAIFGTGVLATANGTARSFIDRLPEMDPARAGNFDAICAPPSVNDSNPGLGGTTDDGVFYNAYVAYLKALMALHPQCIIKGWPPEFNSSGPMATSRINAARDAFNFAASGDPRMRWLPGTLFETAPDTNVIGADLGHPGGVFGARIIGSSLADSAIASLQAMLS